MRAYEKKLLGVQCIGIITGMIMPLNAMVKIMQRLEVKQYGIVFIAYLIVGIFSMIIGTMTRRNSDVWDRTYKETFVSHFLTAFGYCVSLTIIISFISVYLVK